MAVSMARTRAPAGRRPARSAPENQLKRVTARVARLVADPDRHEERDASRRVEALPGPLREPDRYPVGARDEHFREAADDHRTCGPAIDPQPARRPAAHGGLDGGRARLVGSNPQLEPAPTHRAELLASKSSQI